MNRLHEIKTLYNAAVSEEYWKISTDVKWIDIVKELQKNALFDIGFLLNHIDTLNLMLDSLRSENRNLRANSEESKNFSKKKD